MLCNWGKNVIGSSYDAGGIFWGQSCVFRPSAAAVSTEMTTVREFGRWQLSTLWGGWCSHRTPAATQNKTCSIRVSKTDTRHSSTELTFSVHACACESILLHQIHFFTSVINISWTDDNCHKLCIRHACPYSWSLIILRNIVNHWT
jgi:hypothetical protein